MPKAIVNMKKVVKIDYWRGDKGRIAYREWEDGSWEKREFHENGWNTYYENSDGVWSKAVLDDKGELISFESSNGTFAKSYKDEQGNHVFMVGDKSAMTKFIQDADGKLIGREDRSTCPECGVKCDTSYCSNCGSPVQAD